MISHGKSSVRFSEVPEVSQDVEPGNLTGDFPFEKGLRTLVQNAAAKGVGVSEWGSEDGQFPLAQVPVEGGVQFADYAHNLYPNMSKVEAMNMFMLSRAACYAEIPSFKANSEYGSVPSKDKFICTLNLGIARNWMGGALRPANERRLADVDEPDLFERDEDTGAVMFPFVKLDKDRGGAKKIVAPRTKLNLNQKKMNVIPLFMYEELVKYIFAEAQDKLVRVSYRRTSGEIRVMDITWDDKIIRDIYGSKVADECRDYSFKGDFYAQHDESVHLHRGYIRVPSIGESKYGGILRSLNFSSIFKIETENIEADTAFVNVNIPHVPGLFMGAVEKLMTNQGSFQAMCKGIVEQGVSGSALSPTYEGAQMWLNRTHSIEGTSFYKRLSIFMMSNPQWFPDYTGDVDRDDDPNSFTSSSVGVL